VAVVALPRHNGHTLVYSFLGRGGELEDLGRPLLTTFEATYAA
jgi:hypothetical protein